MPLTVPIHIFLPRPAFNARRHGADIIAAYMRMPWLVGRVKLQERQHLHISTSFNAENSLILGELRIVVNQQSAIKLARIEIHNAPSSIS